MKQAKEGSMGGRHGAQVKEGAQGGRTPGVEGSRHTGKSNHPEATLRSGSLPPAVGKPPVSLGLREGSDDAPTGESNHETLRHGRKPAAERVRHASENKAAQKKAHGFNTRSEKGGAEKGGGW